MEKTNKKNQRTKRNIIVSAVLAILLCTGIIVGATFALFTSEDKVNVSVTSGKIEIGIAITDLVTYSGVDLTGEADDTIERTTVQGTFTNLGTAAVDNNKIVLTNITPGDKVTFKLTLTNNSNVKTKYRMSVTGSDTPNADEKVGLFSQLSFDIAGIKASGYSLWKELDPAADNSADIIGEYDCMIELPSTVGDDYKGLSCEVIFNVEQVQGNAKTTDIAGTASVDVTGKVDTDKKTTEVVTVESQNSVTVDVEGDDGASTTKSVVAAKATVPQGAKLAEAATTLTLKVEESAVPENFSVAATDVAKTLEVTMVGLSESNDQPVKVEMFVGTGLNGFKLFHNDTEMTKVYLLENVKNDQEYYYDSVSGVVTMLTATFSPFTCTYYGPQYTVAVSSLGELANVSFGSGNNTEAVEIDGKGTTIVEDWQDCYFYTDTTIKGVAFKNGASFTVGSGDRAVTLTLEDCVFYACDQALAAKTLGITDNQGTGNNGRNNILTNTGAGMCLNLEVASYTKEDVTYVASNVTLNVKNCKFIGENDPSLPAYGNKYNSDATIGDAYKKRGHAIALNAISGGKVADDLTLTISDCEISGVRGNAIQLYGVTGDITIKDTKINSWGINNGGYQDARGAQKDANSYAIRGDYNVGGKKTITISNVYFGMDESAADEYHNIGHINVGAYPGNTVGEGETIVDGGRVKGTYSYTESAE